MPGASSAWVPGQLRPSLAVALSGGRDSVALTLLLRDWIADRRGRLLALTVDHGLRAASATEAAWAAALCREHGIEHRTLVWQHDTPRRPGAPVQEAARAARYGLLQAACREAGIAVLATAHQRDDQRETFLLRLAAGSGPLGLAGMTARRPMTEVVLLRPLLGLPRERLAATLRRRRQSWLDDPSNEDSRHRRVALRQAMPRLEAVELGGERLDAAAGLFGRLRACQERAAARLLAQAVAWHPAGFVRLDASFAAAPAPVGRLALGEIVRALGGGPAPGEASLARAFDRLGAPGSRGFTLGGVRFLSRREGWLALPEARTLGEAPLSPGARLRWGGFQVAVAPDAGAGLRLRPLAQALWPALAATLGRAPLPGPVLWVQPAVHDAQGLLALPTLGWSREKGAKALQLRFIPEAPLGGFGFTVACGERHII